ncbi:AMP-binding protein [Streptomyces lasiicapitis]|uniref:AMP-binding protein n=1 Tax=Streptomyces lasiicapitis TaxID=1923961 RepID=UPI00331B15C4
MIPLSFAQRRLWFIDRFQGPSATYNLPFLIRLTGGLDVAALTEAVRDVVTRYEGRTLIVEDAAGVPAQRVLSAEELCLGVPLAEVAEETVACDGESKVPLALALATAYTARVRGEEPGWDELPVQYVDYTLRQRELLGDESDPESVLSAQIGYWREELTGVPQSMRLPADRPRPPAASHRGDGVSLSVDEELPGGVTAHLGPLSRPTAKFDLEFNFFNDPDEPGLLIYLEYATDLFDRSTAEAVTARFERLIRQLTSDPARPVALADVLEDDERERVLRTFNDTAAPTPELTVAGLVEGQAAATPDATALVCDDLELTCAELDARAERLARELTGRGVGPETVVALALPRSADLVVGMLGILKSGAAYLLIDPKYPGTRLDHILSDTRPRLVLTVTDTVGVLPENDIPRLFIEDVLGGDGFAGDDARTGDTGATAARAQAAAAAPLPANAAYVMYTSGSTGTPKGCTASRPVASTDRPRRRRRTAEPGPRGAGDRAPRRRLGRLVHRTR